MNQAMKIKMVMLGLALATTSAVYANEVAPVQGHPHKGGIEQRVTRQEGRISAKLSKGKITEDQAQSERQKVDAVLSERDAMVKENNGKPLTRAQRKQLNGELNQTGKEIRAMGAKVHTPSASVSVTSK